MSSFVTCAGKIIMNVLWLFLSNKQQKSKKNIYIWVEFEVFTKMSSLSPSLAIPMLQIVIQHLKVSLFVSFLSKIIRHFQGLLIENVKIKIIHFFKCAHCDKFCLFIL